MKLLIFGMGMYENIKEQSFSNLSGLPWFLKVKDQLYISGIETLKTGFFFINCYSQYYKYLFLFGFTVIFPSGFQIFFQYLIFVRALLFAETYS